MDIIFYIVFEGYLSASSPSETVGQTIHTDNGINRFILFHSSTAFLTLRSASVPIFPQNHYFAFLTTQCILIPLRISNFSTFSPAFLQHFITTSLVGTRTSPCPHIFANGISNVFISHTNTLLSLVTSLRINLPFGRRHLFTLSKMPVDLDNDGSS